MSPVAINGVDKQGVYVNGAQVKQALSDANETVNKGVYDATTLSAVDTDLATGNIKNGITIFGKAGSADVFDISDATAVEAEVLNPETFYAVGGGIRTGSMPTVALSAAANAYPTGYHAGAASLTAVDAQLVTGSIKYGITIFGVAGHTNVRDSSDANATAVRVRTGYTFYAGGGARKTGSLATVAIIAANDNYPAGYHAGNAGGLDAIDTDLTGANIKYGKTIFGKVGSTNVRDTTDANSLVGDVKSPKTFYAGGGAKKTGTMATRTLSPDNDTVAAGYYAATTLSAVDVHLAAANIKKDVNIFGKVGTYEQVLSVTELLNNTETREGLTTSWVTIKGVEVPANGTHVFMALSGGWYLSEYARTRGIYNGVERIASFSLGSSPLTDNHVWGGAGVGYAANAIQQGRWYDDESNKGRFSVDVWYVHP